jgi:GNAT superfamily N-acetyltransferase
VTGEGRRTPHLRTATRADRDAICGLLAESAGGPDTPTAHAPPALTDPAAHDWLYWDNPYGRPHAVVWEDGGRVVAHAGLYPGLGSVEGRTIRIGRISHVATARSHRGRGLGGAMIRRLREEAAEDIDLVIALPTAAAVPGLEGAGVMRRDRAQRWFRPVGEDFADLRGLPRPLALTLTRVAFGPPPDPGGERVDAAPDDVDDLLAAHPVDGVLADAAWWRWRFALHPVHAYELYRVAEGGRTTAVLAARPAAQGAATFLQVLHWQATGAEAAAAALGTALRAHPECVAATLLATDGSDSAEWARRAGMRRLPSIVDDTSGHIALAASGRSGAVVPGRHWSVSLASHHDR